MFVDSDHAGAKVSSFCESSVETSVFGSEFVAIKQGIDALSDFKYNWWMMGIPKFGLSSIFGDNMSVLHNTSRQE